MSSYAGVEHEGGDPRPTSGFMGPEGSLRIPGELVSGGTIKFADKASIGQLLEEHEKALHMLSEVVGQMIDRISPVLLPAMTMESSKSGNKPDDPIHGELAGKLIDHTRLLYRQVQRLDETSRRIEL